MIRTNYCTNPTFEAGTWSAIINGQAGSSAAISIDQAISGTHSLKLINTGTNADDCYDELLFSGLTTGTIYTISAYRYLSVKNDIAKNNRAILAYATGVTNVTEVDDATYTLNSWIRFNLSLSTGSGTTLDVRLYSVPGTCYWDGVLIEQAKTVGDYFDGASSKTNHTYAWTGSANASTSTDTFNGSSMFDLF